jgi:pilus assembly protein CpaF
MFKINVTEKGGSNQVYEFDEEVVSIGRVQGNEIILPRGNVSKRHARIELRHGQFLLSDTGSTNGTYVNGRRVTEKLRLHADDRIYIGDYILFLEGHVALDREEADSAPSRDTFPAPSVEVEEDEAPIVKPPKLSRGNRPAPPRPRMKSISFEKSEDSSAGKLSKPPRKAPPTPPAHEEAKSEAEAEVVTEKQPDSEARETVSQIIDRVAREVKRLDPATAPCCLDAGTAGTVRLAIEAEVKDLVARGRLPATIEAAALVGRAYRAAVDLGPIGTWLEDVQVRGIRVLRHDAARLMIDGEWQDVAGFSGRDELQDLMDRLSAGLEVRSAVVEGVSRYRLEEGYSVFAAKSPGSASGPALIIDKTTAPDPGGERKILTEKARAVLKDSLDARAKICVVGATRTVRGAAVAEIAEMLPQGGFVISVDNLTRHVSRRSDALQLMSRRTGGESDRRPQRDLMDFAEQADPSWIVVSGVEREQLADVIAIASGRLGFVADLPLASAETLDRELTATLVAEGFAPHPGLAARLLEQAFDMIVMVGRDEVGELTIRGISSCARGEKGNWAPRKLL